MFGDSGNQPRKQVRAKLLSLLDDEQYVLLEKKAAHLCLSRTLEVGQFKTPKARVHETKSNVGFYKSKIWLSLRYQVLKRYGFQCMACGRGRKDGVILHVDHIKPRSKYPELELAVDNLQVLCESCNLGKSNKYIDDFR